MNSIERIIHKTTQVLTRKRTFEANSRQKLIDVIDELIDSNHSGPIRIEMAQGGIRNVVVEDHYTLDN